MSLGLKKWLGNFPLAAVAGPRDRPRDRPGRAAYSWRFFMFSVSVVLPSAFLVFLSFRMVAQERELAVKRAEEARIQAARQFGRDLLRRLDELTAPLAAAELKDSLSTPALSPPDVLLAGIVKGDRLHLPWEYRLGSSEPNGDLEEPPFLEAWVTGRRFEFGEEDPPRALAHYRQALDLSQTPAQAGHARLALARLHWKAGRMNEAQAEIDALLKLPLAVTDQFGVPLSFYAAARVLQDAENRGPVLSLLADALSFSVLLSPMAVGMAGDFLEAMAADSQGKNDLIAELGRSVEELRERHSQLDRVRQEFPYFRASLNQSAGTGANVPRWNLHGSEPWLIGFVPLGEAGEGLVAIPFGAVSRRVYDEGNFALLGYGLPRITRAVEQGGFWLGEHFANLQLLLPSEELPHSAGNVQSSFFRSLAALVAGVTLFGAYLWWRDTRRELHLARMRSDFVSSVSHELKTPLTSVRMFAETLTCRDLSREQQGRYYRLILSESDRLGRLLNNILDVSKIENGSKQYHFATADLNEIVRGAADSIRHPVKENGFNLQIELSPETLLVAADRDALEQTVLNLCHNAMKYSGAARLIEVRTGRWGNEAVVQVRDHGLGIAPVEQQRIFERFYRTTEALDRKIPGTGLGLALVQHAVEAHQGRIQVESALRQGSTFTIHLPLVAPVEPPKALDRDNSMTFSREKTDNSSG